MALPDFTLEEKAVEKVVSGWHVSGWMMLLIAFVANVVGILFHV